MIVRATTSEPARRSRRWRDVVRLLVLTVALPAASGTVLAADEIDKSIIPLANDLKMSPEELQRGPQILIVPPLDPTKRDPTARLLPTRIDLRKPVTSTDLRGAPFGAVCKIVAKFAGGEKSLGSGFLVDPALVLTAAHVVHHPKFGRATELLVAPGCFSDTIPDQPDERFAQVVSGSALRTHEKWLRPRSDPEFDYGAILLPDRVKFLPCGKFALRSASENALQRNLREHATNFMVAGFPVDKGGGTQQWYGQGPLFVIKQKWFGHLVATIEGQSGGPVGGMAKDPATARSIPIAFGVHSRGSADTRYNIAVRVDTEFLEHVKLWKRELDAVYGP